MPPQTPFLLPRTIFLPAQMLNPPATAHTPAHILIEAENNAPEMFDTTIQTPEQIRIPAAIATDAFSPVLKSKIPKSNEPDTRYAVKIYITVCKFDTSHVFPEYNANNIITVKLMLPITISPAAAHILVSK